MIRRAQPLIWIAPLFLVGCVQPRPTVEQLQRGYVLMSPGVENYAWTFAWTVQGLRDAGMDRAIEVSEWGVRPFGTFRNLPCYELNRRRAERIASQLCDYHDTYPEAPMTLIGYSGGAGIALFAAEALPADMRVDHIILLAPAVSPKYDLTPACGHSRRGVVTFYNPADAYILGWGTRTFGTMDRVFTDAAGRCGFTDADGHVLQSDCVKQLPWLPEWAKLNNTGGHDDWGSRKWAREVLAPLIRE